MSAATGNPHVLPLDTETPCIICDYDLRGMRAEAACPECGNPVNDTVLALADPRPRRRHWLNQRDGIAVLLIAAALTVISSFLDPSELHKTLPALLAAFIAVIAFLSPALVVFGTWILTRRPKRMRVSRLSRYVRHVLRWGAFLAFCAWPGPLLIMGAESSWKFDPFPDALERWFPWDWLDRARPVLVFLTGALFWVHCYSIAHSMRRRRLAALCVWMAVLQTPLLIWTQLAPLGEQSSKHAHRLTIPKELNWITAQTPLIGSGDPHCIRWAQRWLYDANYPHHRLMDDIGFLSVAWGNVVAIVAAIGLMTTLLIGTWQKARAPDV